MAKIFYSEPIDYYSVLDDYSARLGPVEIDHRSVAPIDILQCSGSFEHGSSMTTLVSCLEGKGAMVFFHNLRISLSAPFPIKSILLCGFGQYMAMKCIKCHFILDIEQKGSDDGELKDFSSTVISYEILQMDENSYEWHSIPVDIDHVKGCIIECVSNYEEPSTNTGSLCGIRFLIDPEKEKIQRDLKEKSEKKEKMKREIVESIEKQFEDIWHV
ncbi:hypothetical protein ADUPG1_011750 [Aduncisulcus paluster]|uniref:Uncharacterized protein n=1 Tax=Aduncisulcus paluster TaxID=2918883 RepID=A0ABQ5JWZ9_9EUKA|nr:hypothetical protein ADUPG1_011750 [Aduncisulcus paluster]